MKEFFKKRKNIVILSIVLAVFIIIAGIVCAVKYYNKKQQEIIDNNQKAIIAQKSKTEILGEDKENVKKEYEEKYTKQYKKYLELSDEEKKKTEVVPKKYEVNYNIINNIIKEQKQDTKTETKKKEDKNTDVDYEFVTPKKFNLSDKVRIQVENQGEYGLCWDFAATKSLETNLALTKKKNYDFSEMHVNYVMSDLLLGGYRELNDGGNFSLYEDYLVDSGVVLEKDVEYKDYTEDEYNEFLSLKPTVDVTETVNFPTIYKSQIGENISKEQINTVRNAVKNHIMNYGSIYAEVSMEEYNEKTNTLFTNPNSELWIDHAVTIVGWDDNYSKNNFPETNRPESDGAYIALNSWGEEFGDNGYFYISYEDEYVESGMSGIISTSYKDAYDIDKINNEEIKDIIIERLSNTIKEKDGKEYVTKLALSRIYDLDLSETNIDNLKDIEIFNNIFDLNLSNLNIKNIKSLKNLKELTFLNLCNTKVKDVSDLKDCTLVQLDLSNDKGVKGYDKIKSLIELYLTNCNVKDVSSINDLKDLTVLDLSENKNINNIEELNSEINSLILKKCGLQDINGIKNLKDLTEIDLSYNNISNIDGIEELDKLSYIDLSGNKINDFSNIALIGDDNEDEFYEDLTLIVENSNIKDISLFNNLTNVTSLGLAKNNITDLSAFYNNSVYELDLSNNKNIFNLQYLANLEKLYVLYLEDCNIKDLSEISKLKNNIEILDLSNNNIENIEQLNEFNLTALSLAGNNNIKGNLNIQTLEVLNLYNSNYNNEEFNFEECNNLYELNISNCQNLDNINKILDSSNLDNIQYIVLEDTEITKDIFEKIMNKQIGVYGVTVEIKQQECEDIVNKEDVLNFKDSKTLRDMIKSSVSIKELFVRGGQLNRNQYEIKKTSVNNMVSIYVRGGLYIQESRININYLDEEETDNNEVKQNEKEENNNKLNLDPDYEMVEG